MPARRFMSSSCLSREHLARYGLLVRSIGQLHRSQHGSVQIEAPQLSHSREVVVDFLNNLHAELQGTRTGPLSCGCTAKALLSTMMAHRHHTASASFTPSVASDTIENLSQRLSADDELTDDDFDLLEALAECVGSPVALELHALPKSHGREQGVYTARRRDPPGPADPVDEPG